MKWLPAPQWSDSPTPPKRTLLVLVLLLMWGGGGALVNVAVAWGCAIAHPPPTSLFPGELTTHVHDRFWRLGRRDDAVSSVLTSSVWVGFCTGCQMDRRATDLIPPWSPFQASRSKEAMPDFEEVRIVAVGLPMLACWGMQESGIPWQLIGGQRTNKQVGVAVGRGQDARLLPIRPIWPGFAINTIFYAAILWPLFAAPFALRRRRRIKRGLCPACAYPVGGSDNCTECGMLVKLTSVQPQP